MNDSESPHDKMRGKRLPVSGPDLQVSDSVGPIPVPSDEPFRENHVDLGNLGLALSIPRCGLRSKV